MNTISEKEWQGMVLHVLKLFGFLTYHTWSSIHSAAGFPDVVAVGTRGASKGALLFLELKSSKGTVSPAQTMWINALADTQSRVLVVRPSDWHHLLVVVRDPRRKFDAEIVEEIPGEAR